MKTVLGHFPEYIRFLALLAAALGVVLCRFEDSVLVMLLLRQPATGRLFGHYQGFRIPRSRRGLV